MTKTLRGEVIKVLQDYDNPEWMPNVVADAILAKIKESHKRDLEKMWRLADELQNLLKGESHE